MVGSISEVEEEEDAVKVNVAVRVSVLERVVFGGNWVGEMSLVVDGLGLGGEDVMPVPLG